uniref:NADH dehydrogenase [ubiquinone] 1 beta subcomplex subunit 10 n=1 Tax=Embidopsocus sp. OG14338 TaxID=2530317 RepID=A0A481SWZ6_9NEOP|nr:hypothetical protein [Embidopsocus sp. OG14338]
MDSPKRGEIYRNENEDKLLSKWNDFLYNIVNGPITWFRETIVEPNRKEYYWYHRQYRRVPTVDQCYTDDGVCEYEADQQFFRDKQVDATIAQILKRRFENCLTYELEDQTPCYPLYDKWQEALTNYFIKYGELGHYQASRYAYMKQKHRMIWERRYGPVGSGMTRIDQELD